MNFRKRLLISGVVLIAAAGCGVRPTDPIPGVAAPSGPAEGVALYFLKNKSLTLVLRPVGGHFSPIETLVFLADGPDRPERAQGFTSEVPTDAVPVSVGTNSGKATVVLSTNVATLSTVAVDQIVCTARGALATEAPIIVTGGGKSWDPRVCPISGRPVRSGTEPDATYRRPDAPSS